MHGRQSRHTVSGVLTALLTRRWVRLLLSSILLASILGTVAWAVIPALASQNTAHQSGAAKVYGPSNARVRAAVLGAGWPQKKNNWCGVATIAAIARFRGHAISQQTVANFLNSTAGVSEWGTPTRTPNSFGPGFKADIALDVGTDPRSLAEGLTVEAHGHYHQLVDPGTNFDATAHLVADLVRTDEPISVIVFHGLHSVLVSAVEATSNPVTDPASIVGLDVWDPGYGIQGGNIQAAQEVFVPLSTWLTSSFYWGSPYSANYYGSIPDDPDPSVGPYAYNQGVDVHLWVTHFVYLRHDASTASDVSVSADWAISPSGALIAGEHGEIPQGYTGPQIVLPVIRHLKEASIDGPALWTNSTYPPVAGSTLPASVVAWTGTDTHHSLNVITSTNGVSYGHHIILSYTSFARPSVLALQVGTSAVVVLAWAGTNSTHSLHVLYDAYGATGKPKLLTMTTSSNYAPSLAFFGGQIWIAWVGTDSSHTVNVQALGPQGIKPGSRTTLPTATNTQSPSLTSDTADSKLLLSWEVAGTHYLNFESSTDGLSWTEGLGAPVALHSLLTPTLLAATIASTSSPPTQVVYAWCWTAEDMDRSVDIMYSADIATWAGPTILLISSLGAPALGYIGASQELLLAWTQTTGSGIDIAILPANG